MQRPISSPLDSRLSNVRAVDRAIAILQSFSPDKPTMSVVELQRRIGLSRPTLYRLLQTLMSRGLVDSIGDPQRFRLSHGVMQLSHVWLKGLDFVEIGRPLLERLRDTTGETTALFSLQGDRVICVLECKSPHVLSISRGVGHAVDNFQGATGKAILSFLDEARSAAILGKVRGHAEQSGLRKAIDAVRRNGYAVSRGEIFVGAIAIAAPIFDHQGFVVGSIGLYGPTARLKEDQITGHSKSVLATAHKISAGLGFSDAARPNPSSRAPNVSHRSNRDGKAR